MEFRWIFLQFIDIGFHRLYGSPKRCLSFLAPLYKGDPFRFLHCIQFLPEPFDDPLRDMTVVYCSDSVLRPTFRDQ